MFLSTDKLLSLRAGGERSKYYPQNYPFTRKKDELDC